MRVVPSKPPKAREVEAWLDNLQPYSSGWSFFADDNLVNDLEQINAIWNPPPSPYVADPVGWTHTVLQAETWSKQREILNAVRDNRYVAVKSCQGPGKSFTGSVVVGWWMDTQPDPFVVTSAPTSHQVRTILWREIRRRQKEAGIGGRISQ